MVRSSKVRAMREMVVRWNPDRAMTHSVAACRPSRTASAAPGETLRSVCRVFSD